MLMVRTMIAAAKADGKLDEKESDLIFAEVGRLDLDASDKAALLAALAKPTPIDEIVAEASSTELATEVYTAARLAIDVDTDAERAWLDRLREQLGLAEGLTVEIDRRLATQGRESLRAAG